MARSKVPEWQGMKTGYGSKSKWNTLGSQPQPPKRKKRDLDPDNDRKSYPNGILPFLAITIIFIIVLVAVFSATPAKGHGGPGYQAKNWYNVLWYCSGVPFCLTALWSIGRAGLSSSARYGMMKIGRQIRWLHLRTKLRQKLKLDFAMNDVHSFPEWEEYLRDRKVYTKKWFRITWGVYGTLFVVTTVIMLAMNGVNHAYTSNSPTDAFVWHWSA